MRVDGVLETCLYVDDLEIATEFYPRVLGVEPFSADEVRHVFFRCGEAVLLLFNPERTSRPPSDLPLHGCVGAGHVAFAVQLETLDAWRQHLQREGVEIEQEVNWPNGARSIYFRDPAGNSLELASSGLWKNWG